MSLKSTPITFNLVASYNLMTFFDDAEEEKKHAEKPKWPWQQWYESFTEWKSNLTKEIIKTVGAEYLSGSKTWQIGSIGTGVEYELVIKPFSK